MNQQDNTQSPVPDSSSSPGLAPDPSPSHSPSSSINANPALGKADEASAMWQNYQGKMGKKAHNQERSSNALYIALGLLVFAIVAAGLWIVVFR